MVDGIDVVPRMRMQRLNILSEVADRSAPRHYHCSSQILRRRGEDCIMMFYVLNAVNIHKQLGSQSTRVACAGTNEASARVASRVSIV